MRLVTFLGIALFIVPGLMAEEVPTPAPAPAPVAADPKAALKEIDSKMRAIRDQTVKADADLTKLKVEADDARKHLDTAVEDKLKDNAEYQELKRRMDELRPKKGGDKPKPKDK